MIIQLIPPTCTITFSLSYLDRGAATRGDEETLRNILRSCRSEWSQCKKAIEKQHPSLIGNRFVIPDSLCDEISRSLASSYANYRQATMIRNQMQKDTIPKDKKVRDIVMLGQVGVYTCGDNLAVVYDLGTPKCAVLNYDQWTMVVDTIASRFITQLATRLNDGMKVDCIPSYKLLLELYRWGDRMIQEHRMPAYALIGEFESLVTGVLVTFQGSDPLGLGEDFIAAINQTPKIF